ncbi:MAG: helix-turn-helix transcriptional regulator [Ginsengibacter sp.]
MPNSKQYLQPVKREDFTLAKDSSITLSHSIPPETYFSNLIPEINKFAVGRHFWFIADLTSGTVSVADGMIEEITSIDKQSFIHGSPDQLFQRTHPEDIQQMFAFSNYWVEYLVKLPPEKRTYVRPTIYIRIKNKADIYNWVMVQYADQVFDEKGELLYGFTLITDISFIKKDGPTMMSILDTSDQSCQHFYCIDGQSLEKTHQFIPKITPREMEVIALLAIGYSSKQIAAEMKIAVKTVDNHRQNMLKKTSSKSTGELVNYAIKAGFL